MRALLLAIVVIAAIIGCGIVDGLQDGQAAIAPEQLRPRTALPTTTREAGDSSRTAGVDRFQTGLDRVLADGGRPLRGQRIGLISNAASVTAGGRRSVDALVARGVNVVRLFAPEHGLATRQGAGAPIKNGIDRRTGIRIVSLYGSHTTPSAADLRGLDTLVFDLQDVGVRFYTYVSTMIRALGAAARNDIRFVVLDRPNPVGGLRVEGPVADDRKGSFVALAPGPLVHGLTMGEMARYVLAQAGGRARLMVVAMRGWTRSMTWADTGRPWIPPSPGLRTAAAALVYPGTALLEATNVSEGRGTRSPFRQVGAPWTSSADLARAAAAGSITADPVSFVPRPSAVTPTPKYAGIRCRGVRLTASGSAPTFRMGLRLLHALRRKPRFQWLQGGSALDTLVGTTRLRAALERGASVEAIVASQAGAIARWRRTRARYLLYSSPTEK